MATFEKERGHALLGNAAKKGRPVNDNVQHGDPSRERLRVGYKRATFHVSEDLLRRLKALAYTDRKRIQALVNEILQEGIEKREKQHEQAGENIMPYPELDPISHHDY